MLASFNVNKLLISRRLKSLGGVEITGLLKQGTKDKYHHPLPITSNV